MRAVGWLALTAFSLSTGCSYVMMDRAPRAVRRTDSFPGCTSENTWAYVDLGLTGLAVVSAIAFITGVAKADDKSAPGGKRELSDGERVFGSIGAITEGGILALSAKYGFETTSACREMIAKQPPPAYGYPPPGYAPYPPPGYAPYPQQQPYPGPQPQPYPQQQPAPQPYPQQQPYPQPQPQPHPQPQPVPQSQPATGGAQ